MKAYEYILSKQTQWALNRGILLTGSKGRRGRPAYTPKLDDNLFESLEPNVFECFTKGDGNEIKGTPESPAKMQAVHSSSALSVNIFQYWQKRKQVPAIASACGLCNKNNSNPENIRFEQKFPISTRFQFSPNIDVIIKNSSKSQFRVYAIECKFSEAYSSQGHSGVDPKYLELDKIWKGILNVYDLAKSICPNDNKFTNLHAAQLIKHILGLKAKFGKSRFRLLYLWYDVLGPEGATHRNEIADFAEVVMADGVKFHAMSYQELIVKLSKEYRQNHDRYIKYLTERYL